MTERYDITLHSPMGPRNGTLTLVFSEDRVTGILSLLGFENPVSGQRVGTNQVQLSHKLRSRMQELSCNSELELFQGALTGAANTNKGRMRWSGTRIKVTE